MKYLLLTLLYLWFSVLPARSQDKVNLTLEESIQLASDSSYQSFKTKNLYLASFWEYRAFRAARLPSVTLNMTPLQYNREFTKRYDPGNNIDVYRTQQSLYSYANIAVNQNLDLTGGTFFVDSELGFFRNFGQTTFTQYSSVPFRIGYIQSLSGFNEFSWQKKIEPIKYEKAKRQFLYSREEISETVIDLFFNLAMARAEHDMAIDNVKSTDTLFQIGEERFKIASISKEEKYTLKLDAINAKNTLKNAEVELKKATFSMVSFLDLKSGSSVNITLPKRPRNLLINIDDALHYAKENNPDFLSNEQEIKEAELEIAKAKAAAFNASLSLSAGFNQVATTFPDAYRNPLQQNLISIGFSIPILDWGVRKGRVNMATNNLNVVRISAKQRELTVEQELIVAVNEYNIQQDMINSAEEALELAISAYEATKQKFIIGQSDLNTLTLSFNRQKEAQKNHISVLKNYWQSLYKIRKLTLYDFEKNVRLSFIFDNLNNIR